MIIKYAKFDSQTTCNSVDSCSTFIENNLGNNLQSGLTIGPLLKTLNMTKGYNYFTKSSLGTISVGRLMIPLLAAGSGQISVDTSNGSKYSDYISNLLNGRCEFYRINIDLNWRFYVRVYYDYDLDSNKFEKKYSNFDSILKINAYFNLLNLDQTYSTKTQIIISKSSNILNL